MWNFKMKVEKDKNKSGLKAKSRILALGLALIILIGILSPTKISRAEDKPNDKGTCTITSPPNVFVRENWERERCEGINRLSPGTASFEAYSPSHPNPDPPPPGAPPCTGIDKETKEPTPPGCLVFEPTPPPTPPPTPEDPRYTLLAPLPCNTPGIEGCGEDELLKTFDPTDAHNAFGKYLNLMITIFIGICAVLAVIMIVMGGIEYMTTELISGKEAGRQRITNAIFGLILALGAWTILNQINPDILDVSLDSLKEVIVNVELVTLSDGTYSGSGGGRIEGSRADCVSPPNPSNACSTATLGNSCFSGRVNEASIICSVESSGGISDRESRSDRLNKGEGPAYSVGLWQINLTANGVGGLNCPDAFTGVCGPGTATPDRKRNYPHGPTPGNCSVTIKPEKMDLYNKCVAAAKNIKYNTSAACKVYVENKNTFKPWQYTANECGIN